MMYFTVYFSGYIKSIFVHYEVISELCSVIMMATIDFINTCYLFILPWVLDAHNVQVQEACWCTISFNMSVHLSTQLPQDGL